MCDLKIISSTCPNKKLKFSIADQETDTVAILTLKKDTVSDSFIGSSVSQQPDIKISELFSQHRGGRSQVIEGFHMHSVTCFHGTKHK